jgi:hypothetical protein
VEDIGLVTDEPQFRNSVWQPLVWDSRKCRSRSGGKRLRRF